MININIHTLTNNNEGIQDMSNTKLAVRVNNNNITMSDLFKGKSKYNKLKKSITDAYANEKWDMHRKLVDERKTLETAFRFSATIVKDRNVRLEYSHGATKPEKRTMTYNINYNPLRNYGWFEMSSDCGEYYAEGGLWFSTEGELTDYDGCFSLDNVIRKQLDSWGLDTTYLD